MSLGLMGASFFFFDAFWIFIPILFIASYIFTFFSVLEDIEKVEWAMLFLMPVLFTITCYLFYFLFPVRWLTRVPFLISYGVSMYAIFLTSNIFNVGVGKSLQLYRAAFSVNYFYQTLILFLLLIVIFSFKQMFIINGLLIFITTLPLSMQLLWSVKPKTTLDRHIFTYSLLISAILMQLGIALSFVPVKSTILGLFLTACYYSLTGLFHNYLDQKLFSQTIREYLFVIGFVSLIFLLSIQW